MDGKNRHFDRSRERLFAVAHRLLGSAAEADDAVQETWLRFNGADEAALRNVDGWLTTVTARICLDMLRTRKVRKEEEMRPELAVTAHTTNPEQEALLAEAVGVALLVVLDRLTPAERLSVVLHDVFDLTFEEIASILQRPASAVRQLASRGRKKIQAKAETPTGERSKKREITAAFLRALRAGDLQGLLSILDPGLTVEVDESATIAGQPRTMRGAALWAEQAIRVSRGARATQAALVENEIGVVVAPLGKLLRVLRLRFNADRITHIDVVSDANRLSELVISVLD